ncbi:MAG: tungsten ABC transporter substrate-binding protein [Deltaproteobacteria bacterium]|nr:MAG: tungsten ABC transporter substrate-binding protein [Deltaproteobacteria bacterium]
MRAALALATLLAVLAGCAPEPPHLRLATTTSTDNSGLLDYLLPAFEKECACRVDVIAVGTGKALRLGMNGDVDVVLVHDRKREEEFVRDGFGLLRRTVMVNDFVLLGPPDDPANVRGAAGLADAMRRIAAAEAPFLSRGDESGTHARERSLWALARVEPKGDWYRETGLGMGATLQIASETRGYTLSDRGTYVYMRDRLELEIVLEGDARLDNPYGVIPVRSKEPEAEGARLALRFADWIVSPPAQRLIGAYRRSGVTLFRPAAGRTQNAASGGTL